MKYEGNLRKMRTQLLTGQEVRYFMPSEDGEWEVNDLIGKRIGFAFEGRINCVACGRLTNKAFGQGFCYPCFKNSPLNAECIIRPELCEAHLGKGRDPEWEKRHHLQPHVVYLALSSGVKVGVTRADQVPTRWIDQGASEAIILATTENRREAGEIEVALKQHISDKTNWQRMLKNQITDANLIQVKSEMKALIPQSHQDFYSESAEITRIDYPVREYPQKVTSMKMDKVHSFKGVLEGIKGQYLLFEGGRVMNIRSHAGYYAEWEL